MFRRTFYAVRERARITKRLINELGFAAVAIEGDWPDAYRVKRVRIPKPKASEPKRISVSNEEAA